MIESGKPATDIVRGPPLPNDEKRFYGSSAVFGDWGDSADGKLSLRFSSRIVAGSESLMVFAELRNNTQQPIAVLRPFGDEYAAAAAGIEITGANGRCAYVGPKWDCDLEPEAFATIAPGDTLFGFVKLPISNYQGCGEAGVYRIRYRYSYQGDWDSILAGTVGAPWRGEIASSEVHTHLGRDGWFRGDGAFERNVRFVSTNGPYRFSLAEAGEGVTLEYELVVDRDIDGVVFFDDHRGNNREPRGIAVFEAIAGNEQGYAVGDCGPPLPGRHDYVPKRLERGRYRFTMDWKGRNWGGPSCFGLPYGPPFPPGEYQLTLTASGIVEESDGARPFELKATAPVVITP